WTPPPTLSMRSRARRSALKPGFSGTRPCDFRARAETDPVSSQSIVAVLQVRMSSRRLPGKALRAIRGRALLGHVVDRVRRCCTIDGLLIATSTDPDDDAIAEFARTEAVELYRGALDDVAGRLLNAALAAQADALVRISADSPLIDPAIVDRA